MYQFSTLTYNLKCREITLRFKRKTGYTMLLKFIVKKEKKKTLWSLRLHKKKQKFIDILLPQAALLWISCRQDLIHLKGANEGLDLCCLEDSSSSANEVNSKSRSLAKENVQKIISVLHPQLERTLLDCLRKISIQFRVSGEEGGPKIWYAKNLESQYPRPDSPRRNLVSAAPAPSPAVGSPNPSPTPSADPAPSPMPVPSSPPDSNSQPPTPVPFFPPTSNNSSTSPDSNSNVQANKQSASRKPVVIAVVVTASVTFVVAALFFLCCCKVCGRGSGVRRNDERPLLSLSLSDYSVGRFP